MTIKRFLTVAALLLVTMPASAGLIGTPVTGYYGSIREYPTRNLFDPAQGFVPRGYLNEAGTTVTISGSTIEFAEETSIALIAADFTDTELILTHLPLVPLASSDPVIFTFTGAGQFRSVVKVSDDYPNGGFNYALNGQVLTLTWAGGDLKPQKAVFDINSVPEPSVFAMTGVGLFMLTLWRMRSLCAA